MNLPGTDLLLPDSAAPADILDAFGARLSLRESAPTQRDRRFYDTFDGLLRAAGLSFVHESGRSALVWIDGGAERAATATPDAPDRVLAAELEPGALRDVLAATIEVRALLPLVRIHSAQRVFGVLDAAEKTVVRLALAESAVVASPNRRLALVPRLRLLPVRGYDGELARVRATLIEDLGLRAAERSELDEAVLATGANPGGVSAKVDVALAPDERADVAVASILKRLATVMEASLPGTIADIDPEFLHDYRVAVRRSRAVMRELKRVFPPEQLARFRIELRWLQQITGRTRDLDVYVLDFDELRSGLGEPARSDLEPLLRVLRDRRTVARRDMVWALRSDRAQELRVQWPAFLRELVTLSAEDRPAATRPIGELSGERIVKVYRRMIKMGTAIDESTPAESLHELRKQGKELRYLLELFGVPLHSGDVVKPLVRALKLLQDTLGCHQDREVQIAALRSLRDDVATLPGGPGALMAMGVLIEHLGEDEGAARAEFAERFAVFASKSQRALVRDTFSP
ncbi:MAG TPA: CHAD domain-containing protein [Solirubrobacteraceae bacterium]|jgi:CHAD domain-containing protein|nr:CHAD domain-containing protein [Solirubrobacteraceae bacterium]